VVAYDEVVDPPQVFYEVVEREERPRERGT
jgi:hypothetical protein